MLRFLKIGLMARAGFFTTFANFFHTTPKTLFKLTLTFLHSIFGRSPSAKLEVFICLKFPLNFYPTRLNMPNGFRYLITKTSYYYTK
jgi:hypothetical protein